MNAFNTVVKFFQDSGMFIYPSILIMALGVAVAIERFIFLNRARADNRKMWDQMLPLLQNGKFDKAQAVAGSGDVAIGKIVTYGIERLRTPHRREDIDAAMEEGMMEIVPRLEKRTHYIATFANVITLVGLLGTIIGLIKAFTAVANVNPAEKAELLAASISTTSRQSPPSSIARQTEHCPQGTPVSPARQFQALARIRAMEVLPTPRGPLKR